MGRSDHELIQEVLTGNQAAYGELVTRYQSLAFTLAFRILGQREEAEEVAQDAFVKAYRHLADYRGQSRFSTWLYTIVNNTAISFLRKKKPDLRSLDEEGVLERVDSRDSSFRADGVEQKSRRDLVNRAIRLLHPEDARILLLFYQAEQSLEEVASILGVETNTAKVRLHRARTRLRDKMQTVFPEEIKSLN